MVIIEDYKFKEILKKAVETIHIEYDSPLLRCMPAYDFAFEEHDEGKGGWGGPPWYTVRTDFLTINELITAYDMITGLKKK